MHNLSAGATHQHPSTMTEILATHLPAPTPCRAWCSHDGRFPTVHESARVSLPGPVVLGGGELVSARIAVDDDFVDDPQVVIGHAGDGLPMSPVDAMAFADQLVKFAEQIRQLAIRTAVAGEAVAA